MSNACPKCGAEIDDVYNAATFFKCGTRCYKDGKKYTTKICRVRAEAIAELDAKVVAVIEAYDNMENESDNRELFGAIDALRQWREVRP